jgi:uridine phosphorylase
LSQPIITPGKWLKCDALPPEVEGCTLAVVGFCRFNDMKNRLAAEPLPESLFSHLDVSHQFVAQVASRKILALECLYGGPLSATVIEELAHYGIKEVVGYGYAGSLTRSVPVGQIALADASIVSDGTSREYLPEVKLVYPDNALTHCLREVADQADIPIRGVTVWTTDALYREYPGKVAAWRKAGADVVNMDTSHFYAVGRIVGVSVVYLCVVSDCVEGPVWDDGFARVKRAMSDLQSLVLEAIVKVSAAQQGAAGDSAFGAE